MARRVALKLAVKGARSGRARRFRQDFAATAAMRGEEKGGALLAQIRQRGAAPTPGRVYRIATTGETVRENVAAAPGRSVTWQRGPLVRDVLIAHVRTAGFAAG